MKTTRLFILTMFCAATTMASAFSLRAARSEALFLTDKMAYELELTDDQYSAVYEINLDYFVSIETSADLFGAYWSRRNTEMQYVLTAVQYRLYQATIDFYRPVEYVGRNFVHAIYKRYQRSIYYRSAPPVYSTYKGGNTRYIDSPYKGRSFTGRKVAPAPGHKPPFTRKEAIRGAAPRKPFARS